MTIVGESYEVGQRELIADARTAWTSQEPADDLRLSGHLGSGSGPD
jgi:hypothetical protein